MKTEFETKNGRVITLDRAISGTLTTYLEVSTMGWDIPIYIAIVTNTTGYHCFMNSGGHGGPLTLCSADDILSQMALEDYDSTEFRKLVGRKPVVPNWVKAAKAHGWIPPDSWDESVYDTK